MLKSWAPWMVLGAGLGVVLAGHVDGKVLTLIFATGVMLMSLNFLIPGARRPGDLATRCPPAWRAWRSPAGSAASPSLLGIGGGTIAIMVMTLCGRTIHRAIATASGIGTLIAVPSAIGFAIIGLGQRACPGDRWAMSTCRRRWPWRR